MYVPGNSVASHSAKPLDPHLAGEPAENRSFLARYLGLGDRVLSRMTLDMVIERAAIACLQTTHMIEHSKSMVTTTREICTASEKLILSTATRNRIS